MTIFRYDNTQFPFRHCISQMLWFTDLENLHLQPGAPTETVKTGKDNHTDWHNKFYDALAGSEFERLYKAFLRLVVEPLVGESIVYQARPTFRIHWNGNLSVGSFHKDSEYNHPMTEENFWVPVTLAQGNNSIQVESEPDKGDFHPVRVEYGECFRFAGGQLTHGNNINDTGQTRVSFDFRVIPKSKYRDEPTMAGVAFGKKRVIGDYYAVL